MTNLISRDWVNRLGEYQHIFVAFSGGMDSVSILHALHCQPELTSKLIAVHINHQLQDDSDLWQEQCATMCKQWQIRYIAQSVEIDSKQNVEASARKARYEVFKTLIGSNDALITGHHAEDQVETFFLNLLRGAGITGLASMPESQPFSKGMLLRPLLTTPKQTLVEYAQSHQLQWIEDPSNTDFRYRRNWLRHQWLPLLKQRWPKASQNILRSIHLLQQNHQSEQAVSSSQLHTCQSTANQLVINKLLDFSLAEQHNILRQWFKQHQLTMPTKNQMSSLFQSVIYAKQDAKPVWQLQEYVVCRFDGKLYLVHQSELITHENTYQWSDFPKSIQLMEMKQQLIPTIVGPLPQFSRAEIRFRQGGERFYWRGKTRVVKKLLQDWKIPPWERERLPLLFIDQQLVAISDRAVCDKWQSVMLPLTIL